MYAVGLMLFHHWHSIDFESSVLGDGQSKNDGICNNVAW